MIHSAKLVCLRKTNPIINDFLKENGNYQLLLNHLNAPSPHNLKALDAAFKEFFLEIRFTTYILSLIHYVSIDFDKKVRKNRQRDALILDGVTHLPMKNTPQDDLFSEINFIQFDDLITNSVLFYAVKELTPKEQNILVDVYVKDMSDTSIAHKNKVSQQAVSKLRSRALKKLRTIINMKGLNFHGIFNEVAEKSQKQ